MRTVLGIGLAAALSLAASGSEGVPLAPPPHPPVAVDELKKGLMAALGDNFEFVSGECGRTKATAGTWAAERFWFAKVRPKKAGRFAVGYTITFDFELTPFQRTNWKWSDSATYILPVAIGEKGRSRLMATSAYAAPAYPLATVGDTIIIPVHVDRFRTRHTFFTPEPKEPHVRAFYSVAGESMHKRYMESRAVEPVVRNDAAEYVNLLSTWGSSIANRPGTATQHSLNAYLEFAGPGNINLAGRLTDAEEKMAGEGTAFRIRAKDEPITVGVEYAIYKEVTGPANFHSSAHVAFGTREVRVGDRLLLGVGGYSAPGIDHPKDFRPGAVVTRPFKPQESYAPEPGK